MPLMTAIPLGPFGPRVIRFESISTKIKNKKNGHHASILNQIITFFKFNLGSNGHTTIYVKYV